MAEIPSTIERVTFFEDRAEVLRRATVTVHQGITRIELSGISVIVDDTSLTASVKASGVRVVASRVLRRLRDDTVQDDPTIARNNRDQAEDNTHTTAAALERATASITDLHTADKQWAQSLAKIIPGPNEITDWERAFESVTQALSSALDRESHARGAHQDAQEALSLATARVQAQHARARQWEALVEVQLEAPVDSEVEITLRYRVACALWRPEHVATLNGDKLTLASWAMAWQATGEDWSDIAVRFSTARPAQSATAPTITDDCLFPRRKSDAERRVISVDVREVSIETTGPNRGTRAVDSMPGVDDGGEVQCFDALVPASVPSDGAPHRVELGTVTLNCSVARVAWPERSEAVHLRATATLVSPYPILAGPVRVVRGIALTGHGALPFVARGDVFELGFGVDSGLRVRRAVDTRYDTTVTGTRKATRTITVYITNLSNENRPLTVIERVPVSEIEAVVVETLSLDNGQLINGSLLWQLSLGPQATAVRTLVYRIEASASVSINL